MHAALSLATVAGPHRQAAPASSESIRPAHQPQHHNTPASRRRWQWDAAWPEQRGSSPAVWSAFPEPARTQLGLCHPLLAQTSTSLLPPMLARLLQCLTCCRARLGQLLLAEAAPLWVRLAAVTLQKVAAGDELRCCQAFEGLMLHRPVAARSQLLASKCV